MVLVVQLLLGLAPRLELKVVLRLQLKLVLEYVLEQVLRLELLVLTSVLKLALRLVLKLAEIDTQASDEAGAKFDSKAGGTVCFGATYLPSWEEVGWSSERRELVFSIFFSVSDNMRTMQEFAL